MPPYSPEIVLFALASNEYGVKKVIKNWVKEHLKQCGPNSIFALTITLSPKDRWFCKKYDYSIREYFINILKRANIQGVFTTELTARGVPHIHGIFMDDVELLSTMQMFESYNRKTRKRCLGWKNYERFGKREHCVKKANKDWYNNYMVKDCLEDEHIGLLKERAEKSVLDFFSDTTPTNGTNITFWD